MHAGVLLLVSCPDHTHLRGCGLGTRLYFSTAYGSWSCGRGGSMCATTIGAKLPGPWKRLIPDWTGNEAIRRHWRLSM